MAARILILAMILLGTHPFTSLASSKALQTPMSVPSVQSQAEGRDQQLAEAAKLDAQVVQLYQEGKYDQAISAAKRVLKIREKLLNADDALLADSFGNLALLNLAKRRLDDAESFFKRALLIYEKKPEGNGLILAKTLENLGHVRNARGDSKKAEEFYLRALAVKEKALSADHDEISLSIMNLVDYYDRGKEPTRAISLLQRLISIKETQGGRVHKELGRLLERMSCLMHKNEQKAEAEATESRANNLLYGAQAGAGTPIVLSNEVFACKLVNNPRPDLAAALRGKPFYGGAIKMEVAVETDEAGNVISANYIGSDPAYKAVAEKAALNAKLRPTVVDGRAVRVGGVIVHQFLTESRVVSAPVTVRQ